jgi:hypothetical protein
MDLIKKHADTVIVLGGIVSSILWMNHQFTKVDEKFAATQKEITLLQKDMAIVKTVLIMQGHFPKELAVQDKQP